jgi:hypothetical protein
MRNIDAAMLAKLASGELRPFYLLEIIIDEVSFRYTDCDVPIVLPDDAILSVEDITLRVDGAISGEASSSQVPGVFASTTLKFQPIKYSIGRIVDKANIELQMIDDPALLAAFVGGTPQGSKTILRGVVVDDDYSIVGDTSTIIFEGEIDDWSTDEQLLKMAVASMFVQWSQKALRRHSSSCTWKVFKGSNADSPCFYSGAESRCDRTYARCESLNNTDNFGGFRWQADIVDKEIWWGRKTD